MFHVERRDWNNPSSSFCRAALSKVVFANVSRGTPGLEQSLVPIQGGRTMGLPLPTVFLPPINDNPLNRVRKGSHECTNF